MVPARKAILWMTLAAMTICGNAGTSLRADAAVSAKEAEQLRTVLTPLGAERAGNAAGTIPPWTGGFTQVPKGYKAGQPRPDPFAAEKPVLQITAANMAEYAEKLSEGTQVLLRRFPTYRIDVYPTRRTAAAPQWVYDNALKNATRARTTHGGMTVENAYGSPPFPMPKTGAEAMWNHLLVWQGESVTYDFKSFVITAGTRLLTVEGAIEQQRPFFYRDGSPEKFGGMFSLAKILTTGPPFRVGQDLLIQDPLDLYKEGRRAWQYLVGQRRLRRAPYIAYDTPNNYYSGAILVDEQFLFNGALDRYDWKLIGKREMFVPYNAQRFHAKSIDEIMGPDHLNPDNLRWELHRVWIVEGTLASGQRHVMPKRRFYLDEDSWAALLSDSWDSKGRLWHVGHAIPLLAPEVPAVLNIPSAIYDLGNRVFVVNLAFNGVRNAFTVVPRKSEDAFSPAAFGAAGVR